MDTITYLQKQLDNIHSIYRDIIGDLTEQEWVARPAPGRNLVGFTAWHISRTQDTHIQTWMRGVPEVIHRERWAQWRFLSHLGNGAGVSFEDADRIARSIKREDVLEYAEEVRLEAINWLQSLAEADLDDLPDYRQRIANRPEYQTHGFLEETGSLLDQPVWSQFMRPCIGHIHRHLGELEFVKDLLRTAQPSP